MSDTCRIEIAYILTGVGVEIDNITQSIGLLPTETWQVGDTFGKTIMKRKEDGWMFGFPREESLDFGQILSSSSIKLGGRDILCDLYARTNSQSACRRRDP